VFAVRLAVKLPIFSAINLQKPKFYTEFHDRKTKDKMCNAVYTSTVTFNYVEAPNFSSVDACYVNSHVRFYLLSVYIILSDKCVRIWGDGIGMDLREMTGGVDWIRPAQDRDRWRAVMNAVMNLRVLAPRSYVMLFKCFRITNV
jgi:hypothetical protein